MTVMREIVNAKQTQVHPGNPSQGWLRRLCLSALLLPGRIVALPEGPRFNCRFEPNALSESSGESTLMAITRIFLASNSGSACSLE
jgi:hypothetical protein